MNEIYDVVIIGAGPAGLAAAIYTSRARLSTVIIEKENMGGKLVDRELIENYPSYPDGILGPELGSRMMQQAMNCGAKTKFSEVEQIAVEEGWKIVKRLISICLIRQLRYF